MLADITLQAIQASLDAGKVLLAYKDQKLRTSLKSSSNRDIVTDVDIACENVILGRLNLLSSTPLRYISEEAGDNRGQSSSFWIIDPLDGTANYSSGLPVYGVSIAYVRDAELFSAAIYLPSTNELLFAQRGYGAFKNQVRLKAHRNNTVDNSLISLTLPLNFPHPIHEQQAYERFKALNNKSKGVLRLGSSVYSLAQCAQQHIDICVGFRAKVWDVAAGLLIADESGLASSLLPQEIMATDLDYYVAPHQSVDFLREVMQE